MKIDRISNQIGVSKGFLQRSVQTKPSFCTENKNFAKLPLGNIYGVRINRTLSFGSYDGDPNPIKKMYYVLTGNGSVIQEPQIDYNKIYNGVYNKDKHWAAGYKPSEILKMDVKDAIGMLVKLSIGNMNVPDNIQTPNYGDDWGRHANYIEMNSRPLGKMEYDRCSEGILGAIKMLNLIPPSSKKWANCVILSQLFPNIYGDGYNKPQEEENSIYGIKINPWHNYGLSENLTVSNMKRNSVEVSPYEQVKTFNDLAHLKGLKTGFRMLLSEGQIKIGDDGQFRWSDPEHVKKFIDMCVEGINLGFDAIYFDSAKHVDHYDWGNYSGVGETPSYKQMQYITDQIRKRTGRHDLSFIGEKCDDNIDRYQNMGLTAGTDFGNPENSDDIRNLSRRFKNNNAYAPGPEVSNDNDKGWATYENRLNRVNSCLFAYDDGKEKLPTFMQMNDLYPLNHGTNTHKLMMGNPKFGDTCVQHWENVFAEDDVARKYSKQVNEKFAWAI